MSHGSAMFVKHIEFPPGTRKETLSPVARREWSRQQHLLTIQQRISERKQAQPSVVIDPEEHFKPDLEQQILAETTSKRSGSPSYLEDAPTATRVRTAQSHSGVPEPIITNLDNHPGPVASALQDTSLDTERLARRDLDDVIQRPSQPEWYVQTEVPRSRGSRSGASYSSTIDTDLGGLRTSITRCESAAGAGLPLPTNHLERINTLIHESFFFSFTDSTAAKAAIRKNRMLHNEDGLPRLFESEWLKQKKANYPFYIVADAKELYLKWWLGIFDNSLFRGIVIGTKKNEKINRQGHSNRLEPSYAGRIEGKFFGHDHLLNGQWWPHQLCALRDGAHHSAQGGIAGCPEGTWSIILGGDPRYPDVDNGNDIWYCGTEGGPDQPTTQTSYLIKSEEYKNHVRVIRSERCKNKLYAPAKGYRYDGLYQVTEKRMQAASKSHYIFHLVRLPGQDPIRYQGPEVRPTPEELHMFEVSKEERKFLV